MVKQYLENLTTPAGSYDVIKFRLPSTKANIPPYQVISLQYGKSYDKATGEGTLVLAYDDKVYDVLTKYAEIIIEAGYIYPSGETSLMPVMTGYIKDVKPQADKLQIELQDKGILLEQKGSANYSGQKRSYIIADIIKKAGLKPLVNLGMSKDDVMDYSGGSTSTPSGTATDTTNTGTTTPNPDGSTTTTDTNSPNTAGSGSCVTITAFKSTGCEPSVPYAPAETKSWENYCPVCKKRGTIAVSEKRGTGVYHNELNCVSSKGGCDADFCGKTGWELSTVNGPNAPGKPACTFKLTACGGDTGNGSTSQANTYWDMLIQLSDPTEHDLQFTVYLDYCIVEPVPDSAEASLYADTTKNIIEDSVNITDGEPTATNNVIVNYGRAIRTQQVKVQEDELVKKYGLSKPMIFNKPKYNYQEAYNFGRKQLGKLIRDNGYKIELDMLGHPEIWINLWIDVNANKYKVNQPMYITEFSLETDADTALKDSVTLTEYRPTLQLSSTGSGTANLSSLDAIGQKAATFKYGGNCGSGMCIEKAGHGDCFNMSDWLYTKITQLGITCRIVEYDSPYASSGRHRSVQIQNNGNWTDFPYAQYHISSMFEAMSTKNHMEIYRGPA